MHTRCSVFGPIRKFHNSHSNTFHTQLDNTRCNSICHITNNGQDLFFKHIKYSKEFNAILNLINNTLQYRYGVGDGILLGDSFYYICKIVLYLADFSFTWNIIKKYGFSNKGSAVKSPQFASMMMTWH